MKNKRKLSKIRIWLDGSLFGYRRQYILTHPVKLVESIYYEILHAYQRVFRGWDDTVLWDLDSYLAEHLAIWIAALKEVPVKGTPLSIFEESDYDFELGDYKPEIVERRAKEWDAILTTMIEGFTAYKGMNHPIDEKLLAERQAKFDKAFELLHKHFSALWW